MNNEKKERLKALRRIVASHKISSQEELQSKLVQEGIDATQATLSRDLKALKIVKMHSPDGGYYYAQSDVPKPMPQSDMSHILSGISSICFSGQLGVVKTRPGYASMVGTVIDSAPLENVMGTIAGDDTLLILLSSGADSGQVLENIGKYLPGISGKSL